MSGIIGPRILVKNEITKKISMIRIIIKGLFVFMFAMILVHLLWASESRFRVTPGQNSTVLSFEIQMVI